MDNPIREALEHMRRVGWEQNGFVATDGKVCSLGALAKLTTACLLIKEDPTMTGQRMLDIMEPLAIYPARVIKDQYPEWMREMYSDKCEPTDFQLVYRWNDRKGRTFAEVEAVFEKAAILWDEIHG